MERHPPSDDSVTRILAATAYVESHMAEAIAVADMAAAASYSLFHFCRLFNLVTRLSPYDYLMRRRLSASVPQLVSETSSVTEIALDHGFQSPEGYARAFRRMFGKLPSEARRDQQVETRLLLRPLDPERAGVLAACRLLPPVEIETEAVVQVRVERGDGTESPLRRVIETRTPTERLLGMCFGETAYAFAGAAPGADAGRGPGAASDSRRATAGDRPSPPTPGPGPGAGTGTGAASAVDHFFEIRRPSGTYYTVSHSGDLAALPLTVELLYAHVWPRRREHPGPLLFIQVRDAEQVILLPGAAPIPADLPER